MLKAAIATAPAKKIVAAKDILFVMLFETRQGAAGFIASGVSSGHGFGKRKPRRWALRTSSLGHEEWLTSSWHFSLCRSGWVRRIATTQPSSS